MVVRRRLHLGGAVVGRRERRIAAQGLEFGLELGDLRVGGELLLLLLGLLERLGRPRLGCLGRRLRGRRLGGGQRRLRGPRALKSSRVVDALEAQLGLGVAEALGARLRELLAVARERALLERLGGAVRVLEILADRRPRLAVLRHGRARPRVGVAARRRRRDRFLGRVAVLGGGRLVQRARGVVGLGGRVFLRRPGPELAALPEGRVREEVVLVDALQLLLEGLREALELAELLGERRPAPHAPWVAAREAERAPRVPEDRVEHVVNRRVVAPDDDAARLLRVREGARGG